MFQDMLAMSNNGGGGGAIDEWINLTPSEDFESQPVSINTSGASMIYIEQAYSKAQLTNTKVGYIDVENGETSCTIKLDNYCFRTYTIVSGGINVSAPGAGQGNQTAIPLWIKVY